MERGEENQRLVKKFQEIVDRQEKEYSTAIRLTVYGAKDMDLDQGMEYSD